MELEIEEEEENPRLILSMKSKLVCISMVYLVFMGLITMLSIDPISRELQVLFGEVEPEPVNGSGVGPVNNSVHGEEGSQTDGEGVVELSLEWAFNTSAQFPGLLFGSGYEGAPTAWDIDNDGIWEVFFGTRRGSSKRIWCIESDGSFQWVYPPISEDGLLGDPTTKLSIIDVDNDGVYELAFVGRGGRLHVIRPDGSVMWIWSNPDETSMHGAPQAMDVDGDGFVEFFLSSLAGDQGFGKFFRVDYEGNTVWETMLGNNNQGHPTICDIDQDGVFEVLCTSDNYFVYCLDAGTGNEKWSHNVGGNMKPQPVIVLDIDSDGEYEALVWADTPLSGVVCINSVGERLWTWTHPREGADIRLCQAVGDVDDDGSMDMVIMTSDAGFCIDIGGETPETKWEINFTQWSVEGKIPWGARANHWSSYQLIADIDGDDEQEVLWLAPYPIVTDAATGSLEAYYVNEYIARNRRQETGAWWGDVDGDGISEWIVELNGNSHPETQLYCLTMGGKFPAKSYWPEYYHTAYPAEYQEDQGWLALKAAYSNSVWFPIPMNTNTET